VLFRSIREILKAAMDDERPYALVVLDPLSRFAGTDVETDNAAATRFVQVLESFTSAEFGNPSIIISAHERKAMKEDDPDSADPMRGSSALKDAFRWVARLQQRRRKEGAPDLLKLRVVKTNLTKPGLYLDLCRPPDWYGALRIATAGEIEAYEQTAGRARRETGISLTEKIIDELS